jgi:hypothetical protein
MGAGGDIQLRLLLPLLALLLVGAVPPLPPPLNDPKTTEEWIWQRVQAGDVADLNDRCGTPPLNAYQRKDPLWLNPCRRVDPRFLRALLTKPDLADHAPHGVWIHGARIDGDLDLHDAHVSTAEVSLYGSWIAGNAYLDDARVDGVLGLDGTLIEGELNGERAFLGSALAMRGAVVDGPVNLGDAHVSQIDMDEVSIADQQELLASGLHVGGGGLLIRRARFGGPVNLRGAHVDGQINMDDASIADKFIAEGLHVGSWLFMRRVTFGGLVGLRGAHVDGQINMNDASIADQQDFLAEWLYVGTGGLFMDEVTFGGRVYLRGAHVESQMGMEKAHIIGEFSADGLHVVGNLLMVGVTFGGPVNLQEAYAERQIDLDGASIADKQVFHADVLHAGSGGLLMNNVTFGGPVSLKGAKVEGQMGMEEAHIIGAFNAETLHVVGDLLMRRVTFGGPVDLREAHVDGQLALIGAHVADLQDFVAVRLHVGGDLLARNVQFGGAAFFTQAAVDGSLDLRDSHVRQLDLAGAVVRDDLLLGGEGYWLRWDYCDVGGPTLNLTNTKIGNLQDDELAWPPRITLEGFTYTHLGGFGGELSQDMRNRTTDWWRGWLSRDPVYSAQPYAQLAGVLAVAGNRDGASDIRFFGRDRERIELLRGCSWLQMLGLVEKPADDRPCRWGPWVGLGALQYFVGYGIGNYGFRAVGWALVLTLLGVVILWFAPGVRGVKPPNWTVTKARRGPRQKSLVWCIGASLHRILPVISISKEFGDFFDDPKHERLSARQHFAFGVLVLCGWALAGFVAAAFSGLIQS